MTIHDHTTVCSYIALRNQSDSLTRGTGWLRYPGTQPNFLFYHEEHGRNNLLYIYISHVFLLMKFVNDWLFNLMMVNQFWHVYLSNTHFETTSDESKKPGWKLLQLVAESPRQLAALHVADLQHICEGGRLGR